MIALCSNNYFPFFSLFFCGWHRVLSLRFIDCELCLENFILRNRECAYIQFQSYTLVNTDISFWMQYMCPICACQTLWNTFQIHQVASPRFSLILLVLDACRTWLGMWWTCLRMTGFLIVFTTFLGVKSTNTISFW